MRPGLLREMADARFRAGNVQNETETAHHTRKQENYQRLVGLHQKNLGANLQSLPLVRAGQSEHQ